MRYAVKHLIGLLDLIGSRGAGLLSSLQIHSLSASAAYGKTRK